MSGDLLQTKLYVPRVRPSLVPRPHLIEKLNQGIHDGCNLTLISAPTGFGKTTLLSEWIAECGTYARIADAPTIPVVPSGLTVDDAAEIGGNLTYRSPQSFDIPSGAVDGDVDFTREVVSTDGVRQPSTGQTIWRHVRRFITLSLIGVLLIWQAPTFVPRLSEQIRKKPVPSLGWGALVYFGVPVIIVILFVAGTFLALLFGGLQFGNLSSAVIFVLLAVVFAFMVAFVLVLLYLTKIIVGYFVGRQILQRVSPPLADTPYWPLLLGLLLLVAVIAIPWLGGLVNWIIAIVGVGALWLLWRNDKMPVEKIA